MRLKLGEIPHNNIVHKFGHRSRLRIPKLVNYRQSLYVHLKIMGKFLKYVVALLLVIIISFWIYSNREMGNPKENFNAFVNTFEQDYPFFEVKNINWEKVKDEYSQKINDNSSDEELFNIFQNILYKLDDKHCYIYRFNQIYFSGYGLPSLNYYDLLSFDFRVNTNNFSLHLVENKYLSGNYEKLLRVYSILPPIGIRDIFTFGWLKDSLAYVHMTEMSNKSEQVHETITTFFHNYNNAKGFVIDIRDNIGGYSIPIKELAEYFADSTRLYAISRLRKDDSINSFQKPDYWSLSPRSEKNYSDRPVALLTNGNTQSAAELFTLMMQTLPNVILIGDTTAGIFADTHIDKLPNGWEYRLSVRKTNDANDISFEDKGITPDILIKNSKVDIENENDKVLEYAIEYLSSKK